MKKFSFPKMPRISKPEWKHVRPETVLYAVLAVFILLFTLTTVWVYALPGAFGSRLEAARERMPYPLVAVDYVDFISYRDLSSNAAAVRRFYENQDFSKIGLRVDFSTEEGQKRFQVREKDVLNKMIEDRALRSLGKEYGIEITRDSAREGVKRALDEYGSGDEVRNDLDRLYGWTLSDFEEKIVMPSLYEEKLTEVFERESESAKKAKERIQKAEEALLANKPFADTAKEFSEGQTREKGGELGWFQLTDLAPELQAPVAAQKVGMPTSIIESGLGYHIVLVQEVKEDNGKKLYRLSQIFSRKEAFSDWLKQKMQDMSILVLSPEYRWNKEEAKVEFKDKGLRDFEEELYRNADGDALFFF